jgi:hypothetical protein
LKTVVPVDEIDHPCNDSTKSYGMLSLSETSSFGLSDQDYPRSLVGPGQHFQYGGIARRDDRTKYRFRDDRIKTLEKVPVLTV